MAKHYFCRWVVGHPGRKPKQKVNNTVSVCVKQGYTKVSTIMGKTKFCRYADW
jgi:hypothetical protein